jgi:2-keto-4-pentenoate hydratase/2-oxohepta-3-ene-1,7-dioic acid hydratase in catechol pathway
VSAAASERRSFGRVQVDGAPRFCLFDGDTVGLLDRPAYEPGARVVGSAAAADARLLAPVQPSKIVAVGLNYRAHAAELALAVHAEPIIFLKPPSALVGPHDSVEMPSASAQVDYEAELALVVGRRCRAAGAADAASFVAGYTCANDVTARDLQKVDGQWTRGKSFDTFCPLGPWVVRDAPPPGAAVTAALDGGVVQRGRVGDMIVSPLDLLVFISAIMTLEPGDVILTGTPPGVGPLSAGQVVTVEVEGVGELSNPVAAGA